MFKCLTIILIFSTLSSCSTTSSRSDFTKTMQTAAKSVEKRESTYPEQYKTGSGNSGDIKKGVKHTVNKGALYLFLSLFSDEK